MINLCVTPTLTSFQAGCVSITAAMQYLQARTQSYFCGLFVYIGPIPVHKYIAYVYNETPIKE